MSKALFVTFVCFSLMAGTSVACDLHAGGNFGIFGGFSSPMHSQRAVSYVQDLSVTHIETISVDSEIESIVDVKYVLPLAYKDIVIDFITDDKMKLMGDDRFIPENIKGTYALKFQAKTPGKHMINLNISALHEGKPYIKKQSILVRAY